jgi:PIN domain nuclease of toxin-antitoxin system
VIYVTDTHPLIFLATDKKRRLGKRARGIFQEVEKGQHSIIVPVVVLEEIARLLENSRWAEELHRSENFHIQPYTFEILLEAVAIHAIRDPADRVIVATARHLGYPVITADDVIHEGDWVETIWD